MSTTTKNGEPDRSQMDPDIQAFSDAIMAGYAHLNTGNLTISQLRANAEIVRARWASGGPEMSLVTNRQVESNGHVLRLRFYEPEVRDSGPALIYLHGGGWTLFSLNTHDRLMREYAHRAGVTVVGVDYSLAPEFKFPHQIDEVCETVFWLRDNGMKLRIDPGRLAIGGDSAGGNLSVATCLKLREQGQDRLIKAMLLNYGAYDSDVTSESHERYGGEEFLLTQEEKLEFWNYYLRRPEDAVNPLASPLRADLRNLPPAFLAIASHDILYDENLAMASRLSEANVPSKAVVYPGTTHGFLEAVSIAGVSDTALSESSDWLRQVLRIHTDGHTRG